MERMYPDDRQGEPFYNPALNEHRVIVEEMVPNEERSQALIARAVELFRSRPLSKYDSKGEARLADERNAKGVIGTLAEVWFDDLLQTQVTNNPSTRGRIKITSEAPAFDKGEYDQVDFRIIKTPKGQFINYSKTATNILTKEIFTEDLQLKSGFSIYFIGGATKEMMADEAISETLALRNESYKNVQGEFVTIKIYNALDAPTFLKMILGLKLTS